MVHEFMYAGIPSIQERKAILYVQRKKLLEKMEQIQSNIDFIDEKQHYYDEILVGNIAYTSNLITVDCLDEKN